MVQRDADKVPVRKMKTKGNFEQKELAEASYLRRAFAYKFGKHGEAAWKNRVWIIAETFKGKFTGISKEKAIKRLVSIVEEAAKAKDGTKLRALAEAIEMHKISNQHDPLRQILLGISPMKPDWEKQGGQNSMRTAEQVQDDIRKLYSPGEVPTLKNIREIARNEFQFELQRKKSGAPPGVRRKPVHRAQR